MLGRASDPSGPLIDDTAAAGFLVALDILPKVLGLTSDVPALAQGAPVPESARGLSGAQYKECVMSSLFRARWPDAVSIGMCQTLRDLDLDERQLKVAVSRVLRHLRKNAKLHDLPPLTYQLLLLAGRFVPGHIMVPRNVSYRYLPICIVVFSILPCACSWRNASFPVGFYLVSYLSL